MDRQTRDQVSELQQFFTDQRVMICFNGPNSQTLIEEIGKALKQYIGATADHPSTVMDVFSVYIEMTQNIRNYAALHGYDVPRASATVIIATQPDGHYSVTAANRVEAADGEALLKRIAFLSQLDKAELKRCYKEQLRQSQRSLAPGTAGLGLIEMARRCSEPLQASLEPAQGGSSLFSLRAII